MSSSHILRLELLELFLLCHFFAEVASARDDMLAYAVWSTPCPLRSAQGVRKFMCVDWQALLVSRGRWETDNKSDLLLKWLLDRCRRRSLKRDVHDLGVAISSLGWHLF